MTYPEWFGYLRFRSQFEQVIDPARHTIDWLDQQVLDGTFWPIIGDEAAIIVSLEEYPTGAKDIHGQVAAGDMGEIVNVLIPQAEKQAREIGCIGAMISSRPGWARVLKGSGYEVYQVAVRKEL